MFTRTLQDGRKAQVEFHNDLYHIYVEEEPGSYYWHEVMVFRTGEAARDYLNKLTPRKRVEIDYDKKHGT